MSLFASLNLLYAVGAILVVGLLVALIWQIPDKWIPAFYKHFACGLMLAVLIIWLLVSSGILAFLASIHT